MMLELCIRLVLTRKRVGKTSNCLMAKSLPCNIIREVFYFIGSVTFPDISLPTFS